MVQVDVLLFLKPSDEMAIEARDHLDPAVLEKKGDELRERPYRCVGAEGLADRERLLRMYDTAHRMGRRALGAGEGREDTSDLAVKGLPKRYGKGRRG